MGIVDKLVKRFGSEDVIRFKDKDGFKEVKSWAHTGSPLLDRNLRTFGFPTGIVEIAGPSMSGKTTMALEAMKSFMDENPEDGIAVILSSENRDNKDYALQLGMDVANIMIVKVRFVEGMFLQVKKIINNAVEIFKEEKLGKPKFFFMWDSLGATLSKSALDTMDENVKIMDKAYDKGDDIVDVQLKNEKMMAFAKEAKAFMKFVMGEMYSHIIHFVILNHQYEKTSMPGRPAVKKSTGGEWVELFPTIRLDVRKVSVEKIDEVEVAQITKVKVVKNDYGPRQNTEIRILLGFGIILSDDEIEYGVKKGIIKTEGKTIKTYAKLRWKSPREFFSLYVDNAKVMNMLEKQIRKAYQKDLLELKAQISAGHDIDEEEEE